MNITIVRSIPLNELRENFRSYLQERGYNSNTVGTMVSDSIYLLRKEGEDVFLTLARRNEASEKDTRQTQGY